MTYAVQSLPIKKLKVLKVVFSEEIAPHEVPAFRGAIAKKAGLKHILFHNHQGEGFRYGYPLIQYKRIRRHPAIMCLGGGVDQIQHFFTRRDWGIRISGRQLEMKIDRLDLHQFNLQTWNQWFNYSLNNWIPLNQKHLGEYLNLQDDEERIAYLERKLTGHILSFAKGVDWWIENPVKVEITRINHVHPMRFKQVKLLGFRIDFRTNVALPRNIGLGGKVSVGCGIIGKVRDQQAYQSNSEQGIPNSTISND